MATTSEPDGGAAAGLSRTYRDALLNDVLPFWQNHSPDRECGGYFTCLDRAGAVFDTDKFLWLQARQVWTFAHLYNTVEPRKDWLETARLGADFLAGHGRAENGSFYYALTREGRPLSQPWNIFTDAFAAMGFAEYGRAARDPRAVEIALRTYRLFEKRKTSPKGRFSKAVPGARPLESLALRMIHLNLLLVMGDLLEEAEARNTAIALIDDVLTRFRHPGLGILLENVPAGGGVSDTLEGRMVNPGHGLEVLWMALAAAERWGRADAIPLLVRSMLSVAEYGWDREYGGLLYRLDILGKPPMQIEWDRKMWWVFAEAILAFSMAYEHTRSPECLAWLERFHDYTWAHFVDPQYGEWYGYLNREGRPLLELKGNRWKGCFHVPRALLESARALDRARERRPRNQQAAGR